MKRIWVIILLTALTIGLVGLFGNKGSASEESDYLRVHIRANSNTEYDQEIKYKVRDGVTAYLTPVVAQCESKAQSMSAVEMLLPEIERVAQTILTSEGYSYGARASLKEEYFPTRVYEEVTLSAGVYDALILELGEGAGDNWWCVVYPPLCFTGGNGNIIYKSKIAEIIKAFFA